MVRYASQSGDMVWGRFGGLFSVVEITIGLVVYKLGVLSGKFTSFMHSFYPYINLWLLSVDRIVLPTIHKTYNYVQLIKLTFSRNEKSVEVKIHPQPTLAISLYDEWIDNNQKRVDEKSKNRIAYHCMKNMSTGELEKFLIDMTKFP